MIVYTGSLEDSRQLIQFFRREAANLRILRKLVISRDKTVVLDVNRDGIEFPGLTYGSATLEELLREVGGIFTRSGPHGWRALRRNSFTPPRGAFGLGRFSGLKMAPTSRRSSSRVALP